MKNLKELLIKYKDVVFYIIFGILTTIINIGSFYIMHSLLNWEENLSNIIAITLAVLVAYFTNKDLVFHSQATNVRDKIFEFFKFMLGRLFTMVVEYVGCLLLFEYAPIPTIISKCGMTIIVIILNFFISKFFAFKKKDRSELI